MSLVTPHKLVSSNRPEPYIGTFADCASGVPHDVSAAAGVTDITMAFRQAGSCTVLFTLSGSYVTDGTDGAVAFDWGSNLADLPPGRYEGEFAIVYAAHEVPIYRVHQFQMRSKF